MDVTHLKPIVGSINYILAYTSNSQILWANAANPFGLSAPGQFWYAKAMVPLGPILKLTTERQVCFGKEHPLALSKVGFFNQ